MKFQCDGIFNISLRDEMRLMRALMTQLRKQQSSATDSHVYYWKLDWLWVSFFVSTSNIDNLQLLVVKIK